MTHTYHRDLYKDGWVTVAYKAAHNPSFGDPDIYMGIYQCTDENAANCAPYVDMSEGVGSWQLVNEQYRGLTLTGKVKRNDDSADNKMFEAWVYSLPSP